MPPDESHAPHSSRFDWKLPQRIDMADTGNIDTLAAIGSKAAEGMDWPLIMA